RRQTSKMPCADTWTRAVTALPNEIIESWQAENSIRLPSLDAALPLLDRWPTAELLRDRLLTRIRELAAHQVAVSSYKRMAELLEASFPYLSVPTLRPVPMTLLEAPDHPAWRCTSQRCAPGSRTSDPKLFVSEISPLLDEFVRSRAVTGLCLADIDQPVLTVPSKTRRQLPVIQHLLQ
uniref:Transposase n=1 Tax=Macrostomum lignano TaxID=282301 RepID=A0A1I8FPP2_9PLAT